MGFLSKLKRLDAYRKIEADLTKGTVSGASLSLVGAIIMITLFFLELGDYMETKISTEVKLDDFEDAFLQINFNVTVEHVPCPYLSIETENVLGTHQGNLTKNVRKWKLKTKGAVQRRLKEHAVQEVEHIVVQEAAPPPPPPAQHKAVSLSNHDFDSYVADHDLTLVNFFAPWCIWSQRLTPVWEHAAALAGEKYDDSRIGIAKVDCTGKDQVDVCHSNHINAFPTIVTFKGDVHSHEHYHGDRTTDAFLRHIEFEIPAAGSRRRMEEETPDEEAIRNEEDKDFNDGDGEHAPAIEGCQVSGFVLVTKVPGSLIIAAKSSKHSMDMSRTNMTHIMHHLSFGQKYEKYEMRLLPSEVADNMHKLDDKEYLSTRKNQTHEHYVKIVGTTFQYLDVGALQTYKYTTHSAKYHGETRFPLVKFHYDLSPMNVIVTEKYKPFYQFITSMFAIIGGVFTVFGLMDSVVYNTERVVRKKLQLGKQG